MNIYTIQAYKHRIRIKDPVNKYSFSITDYVEVVVEAETEKKALSAAKQMIKRRGYRVIKVWKKDSFHEEIQITQLEIQKKMLDIARGKR